MGLSQANLHRQLTHAQDALKAWVKTLEEKGVPYKGRRRDPKWRTLNATCKVIRARAARVSEIAERDAEAARRKQAKESGNS